MKVRKLQSGELITPVNVVPVNSLNDHDLFIYLDKLTSHKDLSEKDYFLWSTAYREAQKRKLFPQVRSNDLNERERL